MIDEMVTKLTDEQFERFIAKLKEASVTVTSAETSLDEYELSFLNCGDLEGLHEYWDQGIVLPTYFNEATKIITNTLREIMREDGITEYEELAMVDNYITHDDEIACYFDPIEYLKNCEPVVGVAIASAKELVKKGLVDEDALSLQLRGVKRAIDPCVGFHVLIRPEDVYEGLEKGEGFVYVVPPGAIGTVESLYSDGDDDIVLLGKDLKRKVGLSDLYLEATISDESWWQRQSFEKSDLVELQRVYPPKQEVKLSPIVTEAEETLGKDWRQGESEEEKDEYKRGLKL